MTITAQTENNYNNFSVDWNTNNYNDAKRQELTRRHLSRMPYIPNRRHKKMAVWTDVKEIFFPSCNKNCELVLEEMKLILNYPKSEKYMYPCTPSDHVAFLRQFRYVSMGTLLVQINKIDGNHVLWERVLKRHISENSTQFCCLPATKSQSTSQEETSLTVLKFQKTCIGSQEFLVPAISSKQHTTGNIIQYIPLHILGNNVPNIRKEMVDFCGHHIAKFDDPMVRCCSVEEARQFTIWQFNKFSGWEGYWRHLTTRDLLVSFESCMNHLKSHCKDINITQTAEGAVKIDMESGENVGDIGAFEVKFKEVKTKSYKLSQLFPNLCSNYQKQTPNGTVIGSILTETKYKDVLEKKRQRIRSPREDTNVKGNLADTTSTGTAINTSKKDVEESTRFPGPISQIASGISETMIPKPYHATCTQQQRNSATIPTPDHRITNQNDKEHTRTKQRICVSFTKIVDDKTLMKLVSSNPFKHSIEALKAIRGINTEEKGSRQKNNAARTGDVKDIAECMSRTKKSAAIILPVITRAKKSAITSKDANEKNNSTGWFDVTNSLHEKKKYRSLLNKTVLKDDMNKTYMQSCNTTTGVTMLNSDGTTIMPYIKSSCENKTTLTSNSIDTHPKEKSQSGKTIKNSGATQSSNHRSYGKIKRNDLEITTDLARCLRNNSYKSTSTREDQTYLQSIANRKKMSLEGDGIFGQNLRTGENDVPCDGVDSSREPVRTNEKKDTVSTVENTQGNIGLHIMSALGNDQGTSVCNGLCSVEVCRNVDEAIRLGKTVDETKNFIVDKFDAQRDCDSFHPKKRWTKHFLAMNTEQKSEVVDVQQNDSANKMPQQSEAIQFSEEVKKEVTENAAFVHDTVPIVPSIKEHVTEIYHLKDMNIDHEEVVDQKPSKETVETIPSGLSLCSQDVYFVSDQSEAESRADSFVEENVNTDNVKTAKNKEKSNEGCSVNITAFEPCEPKLTSLTTIDKPTKNTVVETLKIKDTDVEINSESLGIVETKSDCLDYLDHNRKKTKKIKKNDKSKKARKSRRRKPKTAKSTSACSVDLDEGDEQETVRIQNIIDEQTRILNILTKKEHELSRSHEQNRKCKRVNENELIDIKASFSRGASVSTPTQLLEKVEQIDDSGRKKDIRIKRKNKIEVRQEAVEIKEESRRNPARQAGTTSIRTANPALEIDIFDIGYDVFRDDSEIEIGGLVLHPKFVLPYVLVNGFRYIALADAHKLFAGCKKNCKILRNVLKTEHGLQFTYCTWEQLYVLDLIFYAKGRKLMTGDPLIRFDVLISRYHDLFCALYQRHSKDAKHKCSY